MGILILLYILRMWKLWVNRAEQLYPTHTDDSVAIPWVVGFFIIHSERLAGEACIVVRQDEVTAPILNI